MGQHAATRERAAGAVHVIEDGSAKGTQALPSRGSAADEPQRSGPLVLVGLALATSIDAAAAGITLPLIPVSPWFALALIGGVTVVCSLLGFIAGRTAGRWLGGKLTALGGVILIAIGVRLLLQHL